MEPQRPPGPPAEEKIFSGMNKYGFIFAHERDGYSGGFLGLKRKKVAEFLKTTHIYIVKIPEKSSYIQRIIQTLCSQHIVSVFILWYGKREEPHR